MLAGVTKTPEVAMTPEQARPIAEATAELAKHYPDLPVVSPKHQAMLMLAFVSFMHYRGVAIAVTARKGREKYAREHPAPKAPEANVTVSSGAMPDNKPMTETSGFSFFPDLDEAA